MGVRDEDQRLVRPGVAGTPSDLDCYLRLGLGRSEPGLIWIGQVALNSDSIWFSPQLIAKRSNASIDSTRTSSATTSSDEWFVGRVFPPPFLVTGARLAYSTGPR
jgi:hypothetical protein